MVTLAHLILKDGNLHFGNSYLNNKKLKKRYYEHRYSTSYLKHSVMRNKVRIHIKQEKQIVQLLYKKGILNKKEVESLYWAEYRHLTRPRKSKEKYRLSIYLPELHFCTYDYWGEADETSIVSWKTGSNFTRTKSRRKIIQSLKCLPTIVFDNKIREVLVRRMDY